jgi:4-amino-4-deoxy-L-arabinose transferase-like glycosyltransferase
VNSSTVDYREGPIDAHGSKWPFIKGRKYLVVFASLVIAALYFVPGVLRQPNLYDEGVIVSGAERVLLGQVPYRDFESGYPPGQFYTIAAVFHFFGKSLLAERIWDAIWRLSTVVLAFALARAACRRRSAISVLCCLAAWTGVLTFHLYPMISGTLFCTAALWCAALYHNNGRTRWAYLAGVVVGVGILYRHDLMFCVFVSIAASILSEGLHRKMSAVKTTLVLGLGILTGFLPALTAISVAVPYNILKKSFIDFPRLHAGARFLRFYTVDSLWDLGNFYIPAGILLLTLSRLVRCKGRDRAVGILLWTAAASTLLLGTQRMDVPHSFPALVTGLVLLCWYLSETAVLPRERLTLLPRTTLLGLVLFFYGLPGLSGWISEASAAVTQPRSAIPRAGPVPLDPDEQQAVEYVRGHLAAGEPLYVGTVTHSR